MTLSRVLLGPAEPRVLASVRRQARPGTIGSLIRESGVWELIKARGITSTGHNVVVYWDEVGRDLMRTANGIPVDIGAEVLAPFEGDRELACTWTPDGNAVSVTHTGPYDRLGEAYDALIGFCQAEGLHIKGPYWEVYGHWSDDPGKLETTVSYSIELAA